MTILVSLAGSVSKDGSLNECFHFGNRNLDPVLLDRVSGLEFWDLGLRVSSASDSACNRFGARLFVFLEKVRDI